MGYFPVAMLVPLIVADFALFVLIMIARISQLRSILRCYAYAGIGYTIGIYLINNGHDGVLLAPFYGPLIGWTIAVVQNHIGTSGWSYLTNRTRHPKSSPQCS